MRAEAVVLVICLLMSPVWQQTGDIGENGDILSVCMDGQEVCQPTMILRYDGELYLPFICVALAAGLDTVKRTEDGTVSVFSSERTVTASPYWEYLAINGHYTWLGKEPEAVADELFIPAEKLIGALGLCAVMEESVLVLQIADKQPEITDYDERTLQWLSRVIWAEARGECLAGRVAVGQVVLNRVASDYYPDDIEDVILQPYQFSAVSNGGILNDPDEGCVLAAKLAMDGADIVGSDCLFFNSCTGITRGLTYITSIGEHKFYGL